MGLSRVFICHSARDKAFAQLVVKGLKGPGTESWIDHEQIFAGDDILDQIGHGLRTMDTLVFLASRASLDSEWVRLEVKYAVTREIEERCTLVLPFVIDDTDIDALPWFLRHRNATRVPANAAGARTITSVVRSGLERRSLGSVPSGKLEEFTGDPRVKGLIDEVTLGDWTAAAQAAIQVLRATDKHGGNDLLEAVLQYVYHATKEDEIWGALMTVESCAELAPWLISREILYRMGHHRNFTVRSSAASICMNLSQFAPDRVPTDLLLKLAVHTEDWYVQAHATAALKAMARSQPAVLHVFFEWLRSPDPSERDHAASALADIAQKEPEILDATKLRREASRLQRIGDKVAGGRIAKALSQAARAKGPLGYKYGI